jgi:hypothetical protein
MSEALLTQHTVSRVIGASRLRRLLRAGWLTPAERTPSRVFYRVSDVRTTLRRLERGEVCPPDRIESDRVAKSKEWNGHAYVPKEKKVRRRVWDLGDLDFSSNESV